MRLEAFEIRNYKGIAFAAMDGLAAEPVLTISGRNGTGKSLLLEALVGAWHQRYAMNTRLGPWAEDLSILITVRLTSEEWAAVDSWSERATGSRASRDDDLTMQLHATVSGYGLVRDTPVLGILRSAAFQREHRFGAMDFLPANRLVPSAPTATVDLAMLGVERVEQERYQMLDQVINNRQPMSLPSVSNYLVTLDYQAFLAKRQGLEVANEYERLASAFNSSTGKKLLEPEYDPAKGSGIFVALPTGQRHPLADLSSGEQEMLAMMYFVRRLSASGGILCIDEPEQHLHPTLQASLFDAMQGLAARAQVLVVSHSVNLITAAPVSGLVQVSAPVDTDNNQVQRLTDHPEKVDLVSALGLAPADLFQSDLLLVVEGDTDAQWLRALFPVELGRAHVMVAGSAEQVLDAHETLSKFSVGLPWLCVRDRDLMSGDEVQELARKYPNLHVWDRRAIESHFIDGELVARVLNTVGYPATAEAVEGWLESWAAPLKEEVLAILVEQELSRRFPAPTGTASGTRYERMAQQLRDYASVNEARADAVEAMVEEQRALLDARWPDEWKTLVNPKPVLALLSGHVKVFKGDGPMMSALVATARESADVRPQGLEALRAQISALLRTGGKD